jgi:hypothetical protein
MLTQHRPIRLIFGHVTDVRDGLNRISGGPTLRLNRCREAALNARVKT